MKERKTKGGEGGLWQIRVRIKEEEIETMKLLKQKMAK